MTTIDRRERFDDPIIAMRAAMQGNQASLWTALPGVVQSFNAARMTAEVQPTVMAQVEGADGSKAWVALPLLVDCPVLFPGAGGFTMTFPVRAGDECLMIFASRCIDLWWQKGGVREQADIRLHDLSDGFVVLGPRSLPRALAAVSATDVQLRSDDGAAFVSIAPSGNIAVTTPASASMTAPTITLTGAVSITGTLAVSGAVTAAATIAAAGKVSAPDFATPTLPSYIIHLHEGVRGGSDRTNVPVTGT